MDREVPTPTFARSIWQVRNLPIRNKGHTPRAPTAAGVVCQLSLVPSERCHRGERCIGASLTAPEVVANKANINCSLFSRLLPPRRTLPAELDREVAHSNLYTAPLLRRCAVALRVGRIGAMSLSPPWNSGSIYRVDGVTSGTNQGADTDRPRTKRAAGRRPGVNEATVRKRTLKATKRRGAESHQGRRGARVSMSLSLEAE